MSVRPHWLGRAAGYLAALVLLAQATATGAQETYSVDIASIDDGEYPMLTAVVNVLDPSGKPVVGLGQESFVVSLNDSPSPIDEVTTAVNSDIGVAVVLVVDVSGSMAGEPLAQAKSAARGFVEGLSPSDTVTVVGFNEDVVVVQDFTGDREAVFAALDGLQAEGNTALYEAATLGAAKAAEATSQRRAIILLSDGLDYGGASTVSRDDSLAQIQASGVPFFTVGLGSDIDRDYLSALSEGTGGLFLETPSPEGLTQLYADIGGFLRSQYIVSVSAEGVDASQPLAFRLDVIGFGQVLGSAVETLPARQATPSLEPPQVSVAGVVSGQEVSEPLTVTVEAAGPRPVTAVAFLVDGEAVLEDSQAPFQLDIDPEVFAEGNHVLRVEATDSGGATGATELSFIVAIPGAAISVSPALFLIPLALVAALLLAGLIRLRRQRASSRAPALQTRAQTWSPVRRNGEPEEWAPPPEHVPATEDQPLGKLTVAGGPQAGDVFFVGKRPRRIGSAPHCDIVLQDEESAVPSECARAWVSEDHLMFHKLTTLGAMAFEGASGGWVIYESGDEVRIGPHRLVFELMATEEAQSGALESEPVPDAATAPGHDDATSEPGSEPGDS